MTSRIEEMRTILGRLEVELLEGQGGASTSPFVDVEVQQLVQDVVDLLQPLLTPYQCAFYWYLLRHSWLAGGTDLLRVSTRGLGVGVVKSARSDTVSQGQVKELLSGLEQTGAIRKEADPNRVGTLYRVMLPNQIEACQERKVTLIDQSSVVTAEEGEADYYNVRENRAKIYERDGYTCHYCRKQLTQFTVTLDHIVAVVKGGDNSEANLVTACLPCNSRKNRKSVGDFLAETDRP
jgi:hypothetical protein